MKTYLLALECRLNNNGIFFEDGEYLERVAKITKTSICADSDDDKMEKEAK